ncbi:MAG TPA: phosphatase PAP2 family protein [Chloroflexota bacterium]|nr:phosphatase PAP2 family protein [Chloroflexota bacterium]
MVTGKIKGFARDWSVFIVVLVAWQVTGGLASAFHFPLHIRAMIDADRFMFGQVPTVWLQQHLFQVNHIAWYDVMSVAVYSLHFVLPLAAGLVLWLANRRLYYRYAICFVVASVLGFATYIVYPAAPPWMAVNHCPNMNGTWACDAGDNWRHFLPWFYDSKLHHWVPGVYDVWNLTKAGWVTNKHGNLTIGGLTVGFDQVGAIPSEHVMYPWLVFLFFRKQFGRIGNLMVVYVSLVMFAIVYTGQHYVVDGIVGIVYASAVYVLVMRVAPRGRRPHAPYVYSSAPQGEASSYLSSAPVVWLRRCEKAARNR